MAKHDDMPRRDDPTELEPRPRPAPPPAQDGGAGRGSTVAQLRQDIDSGATGDKVAVIDPAMSPLGTDDEAAGAPPSSAQVDEVRRAERRADPPPGDPGKRPGMGLGGPLLAAIIGAVALGLVAIALG